MANAKRWLRECQTCGHFFLYLPVDGDISGHRLYCSDNCSRLFQNKLNASQVRSRKRVRKKAS